jgi:hypothetical protein
MFKRLLSLALVIGVGVALLTLVEIPRLQIGSVNEGQLVSVEPKQPQLICPGPVYVNGGDTGLKLGNFTQSGLSVISGMNGRKPLLSNEFAARAIDGQKADSREFHAVQSQLARQKLAGGLAATNCIPGQNEAWFVAGDNSVGREALLILVNPSTVDATVSLQILGSDGPIQGAGLSGISAPAGKVTVLPLAAFAPKVSTFAVQVSSRGAALGMWLQQKTIRGLTPGGLDLVGSSPDAQKTVQIPGLFIRTSEALRTLAATDRDYGDTKTYLRVVAPGNKDATFTAQVQGADGASFGTVIQGTVAAGTVRDFELNDLADGNYIVQIDSNEPVLASASFNRIASGQPDLAWATAVNATKLNAGFVTVPGAFSRLSIANPGERAGSFTLNGRTQTIPAASNVEVILSAGTPYQLTSTVPVAASTVIDISSSIAVVPVLDYRSVAGQLRVIVR